YRRWIGAGWMPKQARTADARVPRRHAHRPVVRDVVLSRYVRDPHLVARLLGGDSRTHENTTASRGGLLVLRTGIPDLETPMTALPARLRDLADDPASSFVLIARDGDVELLTGDIVDVATLADIPLDRPDGAREVFAMVPYHQVRERGFAAQDDGTPLRCLLVEEHEKLDAAELVASLPSDSIALTDGGFDISDEDYATVVERVIADEIGRGEGANFVIRRDYRASFDADDRTAALTWFRALLEHERGAYWTFAVITPGRIAVGASPEAHVVAREGIVTMNPISGTFRHPAGGATAESLTEFLSSTKETEELFMVVDEELKMMSQVCSDGGRITGPHLKEMSRLTHTEYMLRGRSRLDPRDILRE